MLLKSLFLTKALVILAFAVPVLEAQSLLTYNGSDPPTMEQMIDARERFTYEVTYGFMTLGWIDVQLLPDSTYQGEKAYHLRTAIRSNRRNILAGNRYVNYENLFQYNDDWLFSHVFWRDDIHDDDYDRVRIVFDRSNGMVHFYEYGEYQSSLPIEEPASGGDIIFFFSRLFAGTDQSYAMPAFIENEKGYVRADNSTEIEFRSYDAFEDEIPVYRSEGVADINGPFGFRGSFRAWFSSDELRIPVEAHVRVIFGNVKVRLISYERNAES
ncbi:MAG: DUF3108 domain-containing protein [Balneolaceae bacterium]|nr:MAG: DUF3108 domain-containing protein [Balneolaceae bacterium]